jgi:hypothetical protein
MRERIQPHISRKLASILVLLLLANCGRESSSPVTTTITLTLPNPTGAHVVGRMDRQLADFMVHVWYPMRPGFELQAAPYVPNVKLLESKIDDSYFKILEAASSRAFLEKVPTLDPSEQHPVVIFSHGNQMSGLFYAAIQEDLASHGYVVMSIDHPGEALFTIFPDGKVVTYSEPPPDGPATSLEAVEAGFRRRIEKRVDVIASAISEASKIFSSIDERVSACANLDGRDSGAPFYLWAKTKGPLKPFLYFAKPLRADDGNSATLPTTLDQLKKDLTAVVARDKQRMGSLQADSYRVILTGATHDTFSDAPLLVPSIEEEKAAHVRRTQIVREYLRAFLDKYLKNAAATVLDEAKSRYPEIEVDAKR